jgi:sugar transferase (PEP-CTERM/EpsH1 system associated)
VLLLTHRVPCPPDRGDRIRAFHLLARLARHARVTLACPTDEPITDDQLDTLRGLTAGLLIERDTPAARLRRLAVARLLGEPLTPAHFDLPRLAERVLADHAREPFDAVVCFCTGMHRYAQRLADTAPRPRLVLDMVDLDSAKWARLADPGSLAHTPPAPRPRFALARLRHAVYRYEARRLAELERQAVRTYDAVALVNPTETRRYREAALPADPRHRAGRHFADIACSTNGVDLDRFAPTPVPRGSKVVLFTGVLDYAPNIQAVDWFARHCLPLLRRDAPGTTFRIVGKSPGAAVRRLAMLDGVELVGPVPDPRPHLHDAAVVVAPLHVAPGVQNKVLEAMAAGRPVVATPAAASGIDATPGTHLLTADHPTRFALLCGYLLHQPVAAAQIAAAARRQVERTHRWDAALDPLIDRVFDRLLPADGNARTQQQPRHPAGTSPSPLRRAA